MGHRTQTRAETRHPSAERARAEARSAFTLLEVLVVAAIIAVLLSILGAALGHVRETSRSVLCMNQLREVSFRFSQFADETQHTSRGESEVYGAKLFWLEDFQESVYQIDEFWDAGASEQVEFGRSGNPLICPSGPDRLVKHRDLPCSAYAVGPAQNVSTAFNMRLAYASTGSGSTARFRRTRLTSRIKGRPWVPLVFDVDGQKATRNEVAPYYSAPPAGDAGWYGTGRFWFPSMRHGQRCNVAFIGGHVLSSLTPERIGHWQWGYQPPFN